MSLQPCRLQPVKACHQIILTLSANLRLRHPLRYLLDLEPVLRGRKSVVGCQRSRLMLQLEELLCWNWNWLVSPLLKRVGGCPVHLDVALNCLRRQANGLEFGSRDQMLLHLRVRRLMVATFEWRLSELNQKVQPRISRGLIHNQS